MFGKHAEKENNPTGQMMTAIIGAKTKGFVGEAKLSKRDLHMKKKVAASGKLIACKMLTLTQNIRILNLIRILPKKKTPRGKMDTFLMWATKIRLWLEMAWLNMLLFKILSTKSAFCQRI